MDFDKPLKVELTGAVKDGYLAGEKARQAAKSQYDKWSHQFYRCYAFFHEEDRKRISNPFCSVLHNLSFNSLPPEASPDHVEAYENKFVYHLHNKQNYHKARTAIELVKSSRSGFDCIIERHYSTEDVICFRIEEYTQKRVREKRVFL